MTQLKHFRNLKELMAQLNEEDACRNFMEQMRWNGNPVCPFCNWSKPYRTRKGRGFRCSNRSCRKDFTVTVGTVFENSKVKMSTWLAALYILTGHRKGISSHQLARDLGVCQKTAWFVNHRLRLIMNDGDTSNLANVVEIDETYVGGKFDKMSRGRRKKWQESGKDNKVAVMGMVERDGRAKLTVIGKNSFKDIVRQSVDKTATVMTDAHLGYIGLNQEYADHQAVNHSIDEYRRGDAYTNTVEGFFSLFKRTIFGTYHAVSPKHLHRYCAETAYRFNFRHVKDCDRFTFTLTNTEGRLKYKDLIQKKGGNLPFDG